MRKIRAFFSYQNLNFD